MSCNVSFHVVKELRVIKLIRKKYYKYSYSDKYTQIIQIYGRERDLAVKKKIRLNLFFRL